MATRAPGSAGPRVSALELRLAPSDPAALERAVPAGTVAGDRYNAHATALLDGERTRG